MAGRWAVVAVGVALACSSDPEASGGPASTSDAGDAAAPSNDGSSPWPDAAPDAAEDTTPTPTPDTLDPCADGTCWTAPTVGGLCGSRTIDEDFASGTYNVHRFLLLAPGGVEVDLEVSATAGSWDPVLVVHDEQGTTVFDGTTSLSSAALSVASEGGTLRIHAAESMNLAVFVTDRAVVDSDFQPSIPTDAEYSLEVLTDCAPETPLSVRGVTLGTRQEMWVRYIATRVVPELRGGASQRLETAAVVTWWSLKEGVLDVNNPPSYSNCSFPPDQHIGPVEVCPDPNNAWQVGLSAVQAAWKTLAKVEALALDVHPEKSVEGVLVDAAAAAGFGATTELGQTIASSTDRLRLSWLLRDSAVGFEAQYPIVHSECFVSEKSWCFGTGWATSASFAPSRAGADQAVADLKSIFAKLAP